MNIKDDSSFLTVPVNLFWTNLLRQGQVCHLAGRVTVGGTFPECGDFTEITVDYDTRARKSGVVLRVCEVQWDVYHQMVCMSPISYKFLKKLGVWSLSIARVREFRTPNSGLTPPLMDTLDYQNNSSRRSLCELPLRTVQPSSQCHFWFSQKALFRMSVF